MPSTKSGLGDHGEGGGGGWKGGKGGSSKLMFAAPPFQVHFSGFFFKSLFVTYVGIVACSYFIHMLLCVGSLFWGIEF